jgi:hypothetical protein
MKLLILLLRHSYWRHTVLLLNLVQREHYNFRTRSSLKPAEQLTPEADMDVRLARGVGVARPVECARHPYQVTITNSSFR